MSIPMSQIPDSLLVPGQYQQIDSSLAGGTEDVKRALVIGIKSAAGSAEAGKAVEISSEARGRALLGAGSPCAELTREFLDLDTMEKLFALPLEELGAGVAAVKKIAFTAVSVKAGLFVRYIGGLRVAMASEAGDTAAALASRFVAAVNAILNMRVEASINGAQTAEVLLTSNVKGEVGNGIDIVAGLYGETDPSGITAVTSTVTLGAGNPSVAAALAALGDVRYHYIITDLADAANLAAFATELEDRYGALRQIGGRVFVAISGAVGDATTAGSMIHQAESANSPHIVLIPRGQNPQSPAIWAGRFGAVAVRALAEDPAANTCGLEVPGLVATSSFSADERQDLLEAGVATWKQSPSGGVLVERLVTTYNLNAEGSRDTSYLDVQVVETVDAMRTVINQTAAKRYRSWKLASTEENFGPGAQIMTPGLMKSFLVELYQTVFIQEKRWCQDLDAYAKSILVEVAAGSKTRLNYRHRPVLIGQFLIGAGLNQFK
jgi:phage tail sheath gpL-like